MRTVFADTDVEHCVPPPCLRAVAQAVWLLRLCGITVPTPKEFDDPNTTLQVCLSAPHKVPVLTPPCTLSVCRVVKQRICRTLLRTGCRPCLFLEDRAPLACIPLHHHWMLVFALASTPDTCTVTHTIQTALPACPIILCATSPLTP